MYRRRFLRTLALAGAALAAGPARATAAAPRFLDATWQRLPRWRGFNLLEKFQRDWNNKPFVETDFDWIADWGFNFVRLPCDYRIWTEAPGRYRAAPLQDLDRAIALARARGIHTLLNLHRAPGYTVAEPPEKLDLWSDGAGGEEARAQFAAQWQMFAERYRGIPSRELSFNLVNEPAHVPAAKYVRACAAAVAGLRRGDPDRLVLADGRDWGSLPVPELKSLRIAQCTRGYAPHTLTHYRASWAHGSDQWPVPTWPLLAQPSAFLYGDIKPEFQTPLILRGNFPAQTQFAMHLTKISYAAQLVVKADGRVLLQKEFKTTAEQRQPEIKDVLAAALPVHAKELSIALEHGDWLTWQEISLAPPDGRPATRLESVGEWGRKQAAWTIGADGVARCATAQVECDRDVLWTKNVAPWVKLRDDGVGVMVGEWGCHNRTPHPVVLAWMRDCLANWKRANFGWALWNFRGSFGLLDSERQDVKYENFRGHHLDRAMLELLREG
ncbi:MAG: cellulase family glycosylhydrolase [Kiritimatiellaeota bacterium]|nr:cellulase family glycosylhydrolase [Kiritimatiellota bacterium]